MHVVIINFTVVRLVNGANSYEGRVEVYHNGEWGTVCDDGWDLNDAQVVCRQIGFSQAIAIKTSAYYGRGSGQIWLDDVNCVGIELTIENCSHGGWGNENCFHSEDAGIQCAASDSKFSCNNYMYISDETIWVNVILHVVLQCIIYPHIAICD